MESSHFGSLFPSTPPHQVRSIDSGLDWFKDEQCKDRMPLVVIGSPGSRVSCFYYSLLRAAVRDIQEEEVLAAFVRKYGIEPGTYESNFSIAVFSFRRDCSLWLVSPASVQEGDSFREMTIDEARAKIFSDLSKEIFLGQTRTLIEASASRFTENFNIEFVNDFSSVEKVTKETVVTDFPNYLLHAVENGKYEDAKHFVVENCVWIDDNTDIKRIITRVREEIVAEGRNPFSNDVIDRYHAAIAEAVTISPERFDHLIQNGVPSKRIAGTRVLEENRATIQSTCLQFGGDVDRLLRAYRGYVNRIDVACATRVEQLVGVKTSLIKQRTEIWREDGTLVSKSYASIAGVLETYIANRAGFLGTLRQCLLSKKTLQFGKYAMAEIEQALASQSHEEFLKHSINPRTLRFFSDEDIAALYASDPRTLMSSEDKPFVSNASVLDLPLNSNLFVTGNSHFIPEIESLLIRDRDNTSSQRSVDDLLNVITNTGGTNDAGENDILPLIPYITGLNLIVVKVYNSFVHPYRFYTPPDEDSYTFTRPTVVVNHLGWHFETVGCVEPTQAVKTLFEPNHPFIVALTEWRRRRDEIPPGVIADHAVFDTLKCKKSLDQSHFLSFGRTPAAAALPSFPRTPARFAFGGLSGAPAFRSTPGRTPAGAPVFTPGRTPAGAPVFTPGRTPAGAPVFTPGTDDTPLVAVAPPVFPTVLPAGAVVPPSFPALRFTPSAAPSAPAFPSEAPAFPTAPVFPTAPAPPAPTFPTAPAPPAPTFPTAPAPPAPTFPTAPVFPKTAPRTPSFPAAAPFFPAAAPPAPTFPSVRTVAPGAAPQFSQRPATAMTSPIPFPVSVNPFDVGGPSAFFPETYTPFAPGGSPTGELSVESLMRQGMTRVQAEAAMGLCPSPGSQCSLTMESLMAMGVSEENARVILDGAASKGESPRTPPRAPARLVPSSSASQVHSLSDMGLNPEQVADMSADEPEFTFSPQDGAPAAPPAPDSPAKPE